MAGKDPTEVLFFLETRPKGKISREVRARVRKRIEKRYKEKARRAETRPARPRAPQPVCMKDQTSGKRKCVVEPACFRWRERYGSKEAAARVCGSTRRSRRSSPSALEPYTSPTEYSKRVEADNYKKRWEEDQAAMDRHIQQGEKAFKSLVSKSKGLWTKGMKPSAFTKKVRETGAHKDFVDSYLGLETDFKSSKSWRNSAALLVRDVVYKNKTLDEAVAALSSKKAPAGSTTPAGRQKEWLRTPAASKLGKGFIWSTLARGEGTVSDPSQIDLRAQLPMELRTAFPLHLALGHKGGKLALVTDRFKEMRETAYRKGLKQQHLVSIYPELQKGLTKDLSHPDEMVRLAAASTLLMSLTGIRPSDVGSTKPLKVEDKRLLKPGVTVIYERVPDGEDKVSRKSGVVEKVTGDTARVKFGGQTLEIPWKNLKMEQPIYGAVNLLPEHLKFSKDANENGLPDTVRFTFPGKHGVENLAEARNAKLMGELVKLHKLASKRKTQLFSTLDGVALHKRPPKKTKQRDFPLTLDTYLSKRFPGVSSTDFRKLRATEEVYKNLLDEQKKLYKAIRKDKNMPASRIEDSVIKAVNSALKKGQTALSHEGEETTINSYINPRVMLRFLTEGGFSDKSLRDLLLKKRPMVMDYDTEKFREKALK